MPAKSVPWVRTIQSLLTGKHFLAFAVLSEGRYDEADEIERGVLAAMRRSLSAEHAETILAMNLMANIDKERGNLPEAEKLYREAMTTSRRVLGPQNQITLVATSNLASVLRDEGNRVEAEQMLGELLEIKRRVLGPEGISAFGLCRIPCDRCYARKI